jgi:hypothetical protein
MSQVTRSARTTSGSVLHDSWRPRATRRRTIWRRIARLAWAATAAGLLALLLILVLQPFYAPRVVLFCVTGGDYQPLYAPPVAFADEDIAALGQLAPVLAAPFGKRGPTVLDPLQSPEELRAVGPQLAEAVSDSDGALIVYASLHGLSSEGVAYLLCGNFEPASAAVGRVRLDDVLDELRACPAPLKLLILDAGRLHSERGLGLLANEFPRLLEHAVHDPSRRDPALWVLASNSALEVSHISPALRRSVFGYFVARGLKGAADLNDDKLVDVVELHRFVSANVAHWVQRSTAGNARQTTQLLWGGGTEWPHTAPPTILSVAGLENVLAAEAPRTVAARSAEQSAHVSFAPLSSTAQSMDAALRIVTAGGCGLTVIDPARAITSAAPGASGGLARLHNLQSRIQQARELAQTTAPQDGPPAAPAAGQPPAPGGAAPDAAAVPGAAQPAAAAADGGAAPLAAGTPASNLPGDTPPGGAQPANEAGQAATPRSGAAATPSVPGAAAVGQPGSGLAAPPGAQKQRPPSQVPRLLAEAWELHHRMQQLAEPRPLDYAPHIFRELEQWLLGQEMRFRYGSPRDEGQIAAELQSELAGWRNLAEGKHPVVRRGQEDFASRIVAMQPHLSVELDQPCSLAMAELIANLRGIPLPEVLTQAAKDFDRHVAARHRQGFDSWIRALPAELDQFVEIRQARQLGLQADLPWDALRETLALTRLAESVSTRALWAQPWIVPLVDEGDELRLAAARELREGIGRDYLARAAELRQQALQRYRDAAHRWQTVASARRLHQDLLHQVPYYASWRHLAGRNTDGFAPAFDDLLLLLHRLSELSALLNQPNPESFARLEQVLSELRAVDTRIQAPLDKAWIENLSRPPIVEGDGWRLEVLLSTPLPQAADRVLLLASAVHIDERLATGLGLVKIPPTIEPPGPIPAADWEALRQRAEVETLVARLADYPIAGEGPNAGPAPATVRLAAAWEAVRRAHETQQSGGTAHRDETLWKAHRQLGAALSSLYRALPGRISATLGTAADLTDRDLRGQHLAELAWAERALRLLPASEAQRVESRDLGRRLQEGQLYDLLVWQRERLLRAKADSPLGDARFLDQAAAAYAAQAERVPAHPLVPREAVPHVSLQGPTKLSLAIQSSASGMLTVRLEGSSAADVWLSARYDAELLELHVPSEFPIYVQRGAQFVLLEENVSPEGIENARLGRDHPRPEVHDNLFDGRPAFRLRAGETRQIPLAIAARGKSTAPAQIVWTAFTRGTATRLETQIDLPAPDAIELVIGGTPGSFLPLAAGASLFPFPNRTTEFRLAVLQRGAVDRVVDLELFALSKPLANDIPPHATLETVLAQEYLGRLGPLVSLLKVPHLKLPARAQPVPVAVPKPAGETLSAAPPPEPPAAGEPGAAAPAAAAEAPKPPIDHGLLLVAHDPARQLTTLHHLALSPQRPRRYVVPRVGYNTDRERVEIRVAAVDRMRIPPDGVAVRCQIVEPLPPGGEARLDGILTPSQPELFLYCEVPFDLQRVVTLQIHVDRYPRAFVYRVPCGADALDISEAEPLALRILSPPPGKAFAAPLRQVAVEAEIDAPPGSFGDAHDFVEIGIDADRDREFRSEPTLRLRTDRQANLVLDRLGADGTLAVKSTVTDFKLQIDVPELINTRVGVLGRVRAQGDTVWSQPVEILLDGAGPRIERIEVLPADLVIIGKESDLAVWAVDGDLSGVAKVEAAFDVGGLGQFAAERPPLPANRQPDGRWTAKLPTADLKPGVARLLVRATDQVGNAGPYKSVKMLVVTEQEATKLRQAMKVRLTGSVVYGNAPQSGVQIRLEAPDAPEAPKIAPVSTDDRGLFAFPAVPPGKYKLTAVGVVRNKERKVEQDVIIDPAPARPKPIRIELPK